MWLPPRPPEWMDEGLCSQVDMDLWFPGDGQPSDLPKMICNGREGRPGCPVRAQCLEYALSHDERFGVWGGLSERERGRLMGRSYPKSKSEA